MAEKDAVGFGPSPARNASGTAKRVKNDIVRKIMNYPRN
jgi:hypothetical protein